MIICGCGARAENEIKTLDQVRKNVSLKQIMCGGMTVKITSAHRERANRTESLTNTDGNVIRVKLTPLPQV